MCHSVGYSQQNLKATLIYVIRAESYIKQYILYIFNVMINKI